MEILLGVIVAGLVAGGVAGGIVLAGRSRAPRQATGGAAALPIQPGQLASERSDQPGEDSTAALAVAVDPASRALARDEIDAELRERRAEIARIEERLITKEEALEVRLEETARRERSLEDRSRNLDAAAEKLKEAKRDQIRELERVASLTTSQARQILLKELEEELRHDSAKLVNQIEDEARREADRRSRNILATCMQRLAAAAASPEAPVTAVSLQSDDLKARTIGRAGLNIRALGMLTGFVFIVDDTPG